MELYLKQLSINDDIEIYTMLKRIEEKENSFTNPVKKMTFDQFKEWLVVQRDWSQGKNLPVGYVAQTIYWLYCDGNPVGIGKLRHELTEESKKDGGNVGYAISKDYRNKGFGTILLGLLLNEAKKLGIKEILLSIDKNNIASRTVAKKNGFVYCGENNKAWFYSIS